MVTARLEENAGKLMYTKQHHYPAGERGHPAIITLADSVTEARAMPCVIKHARPQPICCIDHYTRKK